MVFKLEEVVRNMCGMRSVYIVVDIDMIKVESKSSQLKSNRVFLDKYSVTTLEFRSFTESEAMKYYKNCHD